MPSSYQQDPHPALCPCGDCEGRPPKMELRDYFASDAMQAVIGTSAAPFWSAEHPGDFDIIAKQAYRMADAMLKARERCRERDRQEPQP